MAGNLKFELSSVSPEGSGFSRSDSNGQQGNYLGPNLDRSGSFRDGSDGRSFSYGTSTSKLNGMVVADLLPLSQCLLLEPFSMGDQKYTRTGELRQALGFSSGNISEESAFGVAHLKPSPPFATDEIRRFRASTLAGCQKAKIRMKRLDESLNKLKYCETLISKKPQSNERPGGSGLLKMETQSRRSSPDLVAQKLEERNKNIGLNKRSRTPIGMRTEGRSNGVQRQHLALGKDSDAAKDGSYDLVEEKIRRLPACGEGWDKRMKRRRSMSSVVPRPLDGDGEPKRTMHGRLGNDSGAQASDSAGFRSGSSHSNGISKLDKAPSPAHMAPKNGSQKLPLSRELIGVNKERVLQKGNIKLNMREDTLLFSPSSVTKGKASRAHRTGPVAAGNASLSFPQLSGKPDDWEQPSNVNKVHPLVGVNNRKCPIPTDSSSVPMAQWVGQRPQKISRNRRTNIVSPTSNHDEAQIPSEECDFSVRISGSMNRSLPVKNSTNSSQQLKVKLENAPSPSRLSESEENSAVEHRLKDKFFCGSETDERDINDHEHVIPSGLFTKKTKLVVKEEIEEALQKQCQTVRGPSFSRGGLSPLREKLGSSTLAKPARSTRPGLEKNGSKSGRPPLKKQSDRKGFTRMGTLPIGSSDFTGESDDDREELMAAAQLACNASYNGCSSVFWKMLEPVFYIRLEDKFFLEEQLKSGKHLQPDPSDMQGVGDNSMSNSLPIEGSQPQSLVSEEGKKFNLDNGFAEPTEPRLPVDDTACRGLDTEIRATRLTPLYQRVLSALIVDDEFEELEEDSFGIHTALLANGNDPLAVADRISSNGSASHSRFSISQVPVHEAIEEGGCGFADHVDQTGPGVFNNDANGSLAIPASACVYSSLQCQYEQMCVDERLLLELQSFGLYPDRVPDLAEGEDEFINQDIIQLKKQLGEQAGRKKTYLDVVHQAIEQKKEFEGRELEQLAMNRLTELAFKKLLATRGSSAARIGTSKVSRPVALAFTRRTIDRCRIFEDAGKSCFSEPALRDVLFAAPNKNAGQNSLFNARTAGSYRVGSESIDSQNEKSERGLFGSYDLMLNRGKKREALLDDVGGNAAIRSTSSLGSKLLGGAKGKRSERDSSAKNGRPSLTNLKGDRKTKSKPKQKAAQMSTHPVQPSTYVSNKNREGLISPGHIIDPSRDGSSFPLHGLDSFEELAVANEFAGHQDLSSWLSFEEDGLLDHNSMGLEIPMDDLSELNMLM